MKECPECRESKESNLFYLNDKRADQKSYLCKDCHRAIAKVNAQTPRGRYATYKCGAKKRGFTFTITLDDFIEFWDKDCFYCGDEISGIGLDRIDSSIGYEIDNIVSCCTRCNRMKLAYSYNSFISQCRKIVETHDKIS